MLCQLFCTNKSEAPFPLEYLSYFMDTLKKAFLSKIRSTISILIKRTKHIFTLDYRGLIILIPLYLKPIEALLNPDHCYTDSEKNAALSLLGSIITISSYYNDYTFTSLANEESITMIYIKDEAYKYIMYVLLKYKTSQSSSHSHLKVIMKAIC